MRQCIQYGKWQRDEFHHLQKREFASICKCDDGFFFPLVNTIASFQAHRKRQIIKTPSHTWFLYECGWFDSNLLWRTIVIGNYIFIRICNSCRGLWATNTPSSHGLHPKAQSHTIFQTNEIMYWWIYVDVKWSNQRHDKKIRWCHQTKWHAHDLCNIFSLLFVLRTKLKPLSQKKRYLSERKKKVVALFQFPFLNWSIIQMCNIVNGNGNVNID